MGVRQSSEKAAAALRLASDGERRHAKKPGHRPAFCLTPTRGFHTKETHPMLQKLYTNTGLILLAVLAAGVWFSNVRDIFTARNAPQANAVAAPLSFKIDGNPPKSGHHTRAYHPTRLLYFIGIRS
jgi:hypothetical protein